jgi:uncharacterized protein
MGIIATMLTILSLFGRSPFSPMQTHMETVAKCVRSLPKLFEAIDKKNYELANKIREEISSLEHQADLQKNDIRNHLPKTIFLPIARQDLLAILSLQDSIADCAEDVSVLATLQNLAMSAEFKVLFNEFLSMNLQAFEGARLIIHEMRQLLESSFGGEEAEKVRTMIADVAYKEHQADLSQRKMLSHLFNHADDLHFSHFFLWQRLLESLAQISNLSENLAYKLRATLDLK